MGAKTAGRVGDGWERWRGCGEKAMAASAETEPATSMDGIAVQRRGGGTVTDRPSSKVIVGDASGEGYARVAVGEKWDDKEEAG